MQLSAQQFPNFKFKRLTTKDGLSGNAITYTFKDSKGLLWFGTTEGLNRYDGKEFKIYKHSTINKNTIAGNHILNISEDKKGNIWTNTFDGGISCLDIHTEKFVNYLPNDQVENALKARYQMVLDDSSQIIYTTAPQWMDINTNQWHSIPLVNDNINIPKVDPILVKRDIVKCTDGSIFLYGYNGVFKLNKKAKKFERVFSRLNDPISFFKDHTGKCWLGDWKNGLQEIDFIGQKLKTTIPNCRINFITEYKDINGKYWIIAAESSRGQIYCIDPITGKYNFQLFKPENEIIANALTGQIFIDSESRLWVGSTEGIFVSEPTTNAFTNTWLYDRTKPFDPYYDGLVRTVFKTDKHYAVALLNNGVKIFDANFKELQYIKNVTDAYGKKITLDIRASTTLPDGKIISSGENGAFYFNQNGNIKYLCKAPTINSINYTSQWREMLPITDNLYWVRFFNHIVGVYNVKDNKFVKTYKLFSKTNDIETRSICYDSNKKLWIAANRGLFYYDTRLDSFRTKEIPSRTPQSAYQTNDIYFINTEAKNYLWISTNTGLVKYNLITEQFTHINYESNSSNLTYKTIWGNNGKLWIFNYKGLAIYDTATNTSTLYSVNEGLPTSSYSRDVAFFKLDSTRLLLGSEGVFTVVNTTALEKIKIKKPIVTILQIEGIDTLLPIKKVDNNIYETTVSFKNFPINILFNIIDYNTVSIRKYYYTLEGTKDTSWQLLTNGIYPLNTIKPGKYKIWFTGSVNDVWSANPQCIIITIAPFWYQTLWFKVLAIVISIIAIIAFFRWRVNMAKKSEMQQTQIEKLKNEELQNQLEQEQITNYFSTSIQHINTEEAVLWDVAKNLISKLGFEDCIIYQWNNDKTKMIQKAGYGLTGSIDEIEKPTFDVVAGQGIVGIVMQTKEPILLQDTTKESRYRIDEIMALSEICVPMLYNEQLIGIIDSENQQKNYFTQRHLQTLVNIATLTASKLGALQANERTQKKQQELQISNQQLETAKLEALRSQMNPHFIFNCLNSIKLYTAQNETEAAGIYLTKFSKLIRMALENSRSETITLQTELEALELYIELEAMRFKDKLNYTITVDKTVDITFIDIPPLLLQPFVENAIWHGLMHKVEGGLIEINVVNIITENLLSITIKDNGVGREKSALLRGKSATKHKSQGTKVTAERIALINKIYKTNASVTTEDVLDNNGTIAGTLVTNKVPIE